MAIESTDHASTMGPPRTAMSPAKTPNSTHDPGQQRSGPQSWHQRCRGVVPIRVSRRCYGMSFGFKALVQRIRDR
jgi:hypothetical protein